MGSLRPLLLCLALYLTANLCQGKVTFEKLTNQDYSGTVYYTVWNVSLYECLGWCRDESECAAAAFSFVVNPLTPNQETTCQLQNETQANRPTAMSQRSVNTYFMVKLHLRTDSVCNRLWSFERVPNQSLRGLENAIIFTSNKEACLSACLGEVRFVCRSVEFNYVTKECRLSEFDRRSPGVYVHMVDSQGVDYFENACLQPDKVCRGPKNYGYAPVNLPQTSLTYYIDLNYYLDKQILVNTRQECLQQCSLEREFVCRSVLFRAEPRTKKAICKLFHLDHIMFPDGAETFATPNPFPLLDTGDSTGVYLEAICANDTSKRNKPSKGNINLGMNQQQQQQQQHQQSPQPQSPTTVPFFPNTQDPSCDVYGVCYDVSIQCTDSKIIVYVKTNRHFHGRIYALGRSETCHANVLNSNQFRLDLSLSGQDCNTQSMGGVYTNTVVLQHHNVVMTRTDKVYNVRCTYEVTSRNISFGMMPIRDPDTMQVTASPEAPLPKIVILGIEGREANTVRIGDKLTFRIEIPEGTPYGIFARSCVAMAKDARSIFEVIDDRGCPVDANIFPRFREIGSSLESSYEAFRFTESYGVIFQCNVKYCIGKCEPVNCGIGMEKTSSWGRKRRSQPIEKEDSEMTLSHEILVLDFGDESVSSMRDVNSVNESTHYKESVLMMDTCASKTSLMALSVTSALLLVFYICTVAYFVAQRRVTKEFR
ncbi:unnamed protein product [Larinioides sclopetarius]|uniref:Cuticlin-1 n=1 Tax=Larinioides sclopetarius TaxID=280406 RepID=A0AAV1ZXB6_9ARAC